jgi:tetratricopeptide (TPR) repeat protein
MSSSSKKLPEGLVTSDTVQGKRRLPKKLIISMVPGFIVVAAVTGALLYLAHNHGPSRSRSSQSATKNANTSLIHPEQGVVDAQSRVNTARTSQEKAAAYADLGAAYINNKQADQAISAYQSAAAIDSPYQIPALSGLGYAYAGAGQRAQAISTFQKLVGILKQTDDPHSKQAVINYEYLIQQLQQGKSIV